MSDSTDQLARFASANWNVTRVDGHDPTEVAAALEAAQSSDKPSLIACKTIIGLWRAQQARHGRHPWLAAGCRRNRRRPQRRWAGTIRPFDVPDDILNAWRAAGSRGASAARSLGTAPCQLHRTRPNSSAPHLAPCPQISTDVDRHLQKGAGEKSAAGIATRNASQNALDVINAAVPETIGGSADLTGSNNTKSKDMKALNAADYGGRYVYYGIREHGMAAAMNGMALHGGVIPYGGTFLTFTDYCRPSIRLVGAHGHARDLCDDP